MGRTDTNKRVVLPYAPLGRVVAGEGTGEPELPAPGDYVAVRVTESLSANTLRATPLTLSSITQFAKAGM